MMTKVLILVCGLGVWASGALAQVAVIAHVSVPVDEITRGELLDFYTGDVRSWKGGVQIVVVDLKPKGEVKEVFYKFLGKTPSRMKSIWLRKMLSGEGEPPEALETEEAMLQKVGSTPGSIGFISPALVDGEVKVLYVIELEKS